MSDIFISYASADRDRAATLAHALQARGWSVWWDRVIPPGRQFDEVIEEALDAARCVVVLWSKASAASNWVKTEAAEAMRRKALIPALIDAEAKIPLEFRRLQAANLAGWNGEATTPEFEQFCEAIAANVAPGPPAPSPPSSPPPAPPPGPKPPGPPPPSATPPGPEPARRSRSKTVAIVASVIAVIAVLAAVGLAQQDNEREPVMNGGGNAPNPNPAMASVPGFQMNLNWRDYVLRYSGTVSWDGMSPNALITARIVDGNNGQVLGDQRFSANVNSIGSGRYAFSTRVNVPGDSQTPGPHTHDMNLILQLQPNGGWVFIQNCMDPQRCF